MDLKRLFNCEFFRLWRLQGESPFTVGAIGEPRVLVCLEGTGSLKACTLRITQSRRLSNIDQTSVLAEVIIGGT